MKIQSKKLNEKVLAIIADFYLITENNASDFIRDTTRTTNLKLTLTELTNKILEDPENLQWVLDEGFFDATGDADPATEPDVVLAQFQSWQWRLQKQIERENAAIDRLNKIAEVASDFIDEAYK